jgi:hypothetical protein
MDTTKRALPVLGIAVACLLVGSAGGAVAGRLVTSADIKDGTVRSADLQNHSVQPIDLGKKTTARLGTVTGYKVKKVTGDLVANGDQDGFGVSCPRGRVLLGASGYWLNDDRAPQVYQVDADTAAILGTNRWSGGEDSLTLIVACAKAGPGALSAKVLGGTPVKPVG